jgi:hypothetical protein
MICLCPRLREAVPSFCSCSSWPMRSETLPRSGTVDLHQRVFVQRALDEQGEDEGGKEDPRLHLAGNLTPASAMLRITTHAISQESTRGTSARCKPGALSFLVGIALDGFPGLAVLTTVALAGLEHALADQSADADQAVAGMLQRVHALGVVVLLTGEAARHDGVSLQPLGPPRDRIQPVPDWDRRPREAGQPSRWRHRRLACGSRGTRRCGRPCRQGEIGVRRRRGRGSRRRSDGSTGGAALGSLVAGIALPSIHHAAEYEARQTS